MDAVVKFLYFDAIFAFSSAFVYSCMVIVRSIVQRILSSKLIDIPESIKPLLGPSSGSTPLENSFMHLTVTVIYMILTLAIAIYIFDVMNVLSDLMRAI